MLHHNPVQLFSSLAVTLALAAAPAAAQQQQKVDTIAIVVRNITTDTSKGQQTVQVTPDQPAQLKPGQVLALRDFRGDSTWGSRGEVQARIAPPGGFTFDDIAVLARDLLTPAAPQNNAQGDTMTVVVEIIDIVKPGALVRVTSRQAADIKAGQVVQFRKDRSISSTDSSATKKGSNAKQGMP